MKNLFASCIILGLTTLTAYADTNNNPWVDLTHDFSSDTVYWPTDKPFELKVDFQGNTLKGYYYSTKEFSASEHGGTHVDAPSHFAKGKRSIEQIPLSQLMGKAVIINLKEKTLPDDDYLITIGDIKEWEKNYGQIPNRSIVIFYTGYSQYWPDAFKYLGAVIKGPDSVDALHFPGLAKDTAEWLINNRGVKAIGIDTASIDYGQTLQFPTHQVLAQNNIPIFENIANLEQIQSPFAEVVALPMKIKDGTGAPLRLVARALPYEPKNPPKDTSKNKASDENSDKATETASDDTQSTEDDSDAPE